MRYFVAAFCVFFLFPSFAQDFSISGRAIASSDDRVRVLVYADQFSMLEKTIAETYTDSDGNFSLSGELNAIDFGFLALNLEKNQFFITPEASYSVEIPKQDSFNTGSVFDRIPLQFALKAEDDNDLQNDIGLFNQMYNEFIYQNAQAIYRSRNRAVIDKFRAEVDTHFATSKSEYLDNYIHYTFVSLDWISKRMSDSQVLEKELINKPILSNNIQYTEFFKSFFDNYLKSFVNKNYNTITQHLNKDKDCLALLAMLAQDTLLVKNKQVSELVFVLMMSDLYYSSDIDKYQVIQKLDQLSVTSKFALIRKVAGNFKVRLTHLDYGYAAPDFNLKSISGKSVSLNSLNEKFVLMAWVTDDCPKCIFDQAQITKILPSFNDSVAFLILQTGYNEKPFSEILLGSTFHSEIVFVADTSLLPETYKIKTYPSYMLINPDGTMAYATLPMPEEHMELFIRRFMKRYYK